jgi:hypothetical protein
VVFTNGKKELVSVPSDEFPIEEETTYLNLITNFVCIRK